MIPWQRVRGDSSARVWHLVVDDPEVTHDGKVTIYCRPGVRGVWSDRSAVAAVLPDGHRWCGHCVAAYARQVHRYAETLDRIRAAQ